MDCVGELRARLLPLLRQWERQLSAEHPEVDVTVWDRPVGSLTQWQGHDIGLNCLLPNAAPDQPDNVALSVGLNHLNGTPMLCSADVVWGHPSGTVESDVLPGPVPFSADALDDVLTHLPELLAALQDALRRGRPQR